MDGILWCDASAAPTRRELRCRPPVRPLLLLGAQIISSSSLLAGKKMCRASRQQEAASSVHRKWRGHQPARQAKRAPAGEESLSFLPTRSFSRCSLSLRHQLFLCGSLLERAFDRRAERRSQRARFGLERGASMLSPLLSRMVLSFFLFPFFPFLPRQLTFNRPPPSLVSTTSA